MGTLRPKYLLYGYMEPLGEFQDIVQEQRAPNPVGGPKPYKLLGYGPFPGLRSTIL